MNILKKIQRLTRTEKAAQNTIKKNDDPFWFSSDFSEQEKQTLATVAPFTMTSKERLINLVRAVNYIHASNIEGAIVECGVWKGGSSMAAAITLNTLGDRSRQLYLYDTYDGMTEPSDKDISADGIEATVQLSQSSKDDPDSVWCYSALEDVRMNMEATGYPTENIFFIKGKVEDTIPREIPDKIALLRLDTDWYESTKHELVHLFPRLQAGGILIIDDYGHWKGCRQAVDEYIAQHNVRLFLARIDYTGRIGVKL